MANHPPSWASRGLTALLLLAVVLDMGCVSGMRRSYPPEWPARVVLQDRCADVTGEWDNAAEPDRVLAEPRDLSKAIFDADGGSKGMEAWRRIRIEYPGGGVLVARALGEGDEPPTLRSFTRGVDLACREDAVELTLEDRWHGESILVWHTARRTLLARDREGFLVVRSSTREAIVFPIPGLVDNAEWTRHRPATER